MAERSYGCERACGRPYDVIVTQVADMTSEALCYPCFVQQAATVLAAIVEQDNAETAHAVSMVGELNHAPMTESTVRPPGHNAPVTSDDDDLISAYDSRMTVDELPPEFR
jgi:hypothetical protein